MPNRPTAAELVAAARHYLVAELLPTVTDARLLEHGQIAVQALDIVERELAASAALTALAAESELAAARQLAARIRAGDFDTGSARAEVIAQIRANVEAKLRLTNPDLVARADAT